ncbi:MAG: hypothetical protein K0U74_04070, partial [Alphaproteobacteria bacterium]|nr:hypothetical protein [Alphaproteobacteria bacterium]
MRFVDDGPDIPAELIAAQESGEVVFLYGAGASMTAGLPSFRELAEGTYSALDVYFQKVVRFLHWRLSIRSGPGTLMLRNVSDSPEDRMNVHKNAPLT